MKRNAALLLAVIVLVGAVLVIRSIPSEYERLVERVVQSLNLGELDEAEESLAQLAAITKDSVDLTAVESVRMAVAIAQVIRDVQLAIEYEAVGLMLAEQEVDVPGYEGILRSLQESFKTRQDQMMSMARTYHGQHFQLGLRLRSPLSGVLNLPSEDDEEVAAAFNELLLGEADSASHAIIYDSVAREAVGAVLRLVITQPEEATAETVHLEGNLDLAELWWLIAAHSPNSLFSETALDIVLEEAEEGHPARKRALEALRHFGRIS